MAAIVLTPAMFDQIPYNIERGEIDSSFADFLELAEIDALEMILGSDLYEQFKDGIAEAVPATKWVDLRDGKTYEYKDKTYKYKGLEALLVPYASSEWLNKMAKRQTSSGTAELPAENSTLITSIDRVVRDYNMFSKLVGNKCKLKDTFYGFMAATYEVDYPTWRFKKPGTMNSFNL